MLFLGILLPLNRPEKKYKFIESTVKQELLRNELNLQCIEKWISRYLKIDNPVAILWENWVASIGSIWRGFGWDSSQTEVLQSPWISKKWPKHLLIFPSAQYNHIVGGMMKKREAQKIEEKKTKNQIGFEYLWFRRRARKLNKFYPRLTFLYF